MNYLTKYKDSILNLIIEYTPRLIAAVILLIVGIWIIRFINKIVRNVMIRRNIEPTLIEFLSNIIFWALRITLFIAVITKLGVESSSFVAILGAAGLAVGLSLQGSLSNFAGGMLIILFKPFKLSDTITAQGVTGEVVDIQIFVTQLISGNNQAIFIPNGALSNGTIVNFSKYEHRKTELIISLSYDTNIKIAKNLILNVLENNSKILKNPEATVVVKELSDIAMRLTINAWARNEDFAQVTSEILEDCKTAFDEKEIAFQPYTIEK